jgi:hypothetical protein
VQGDERIADQAHGIEAAVVAAAVVDEQPGAIRPGRLVGAGRHDLIVAEGDRLPPSLQWLTAGADAALRHPHIPAA